MSFSIDLPSASFDVVRRAAVKTLPAAVVISGAINLLALTLPIFIMQVFDRVLAGQSMDTLGFLVLAALIALLTSAILDAIRGRLFAQVADWGAAQCGPDLLRRMLERPAAEQRMHGDLLRELVQLRNFVAGPVPGAMLDVPWAPLFLLIAFLIHPVIGGVALTGAILLFMLTLANERLTRADVARAARLSGANLRYGDSLLRNSEVIEAMGMADHVVGRWQRGLKVESGLNERAHRNGVISLNLLRFARSAIQVAVYAVAAILVVKHELTGGAMVAGSIIVARLLAPIDALLHQWRSVMLARESYRRLNEFCQTSRMRGTGISLPAPNGQLTASRVSVTLPGHSYPILRNVEFELPAGEQMAIIGPAASGKTTLVRVLMGLMRPQIGVIRLDGVDVSTWHRSEFGQYVGYLPQDVELFAGSVAENISRFNGDADDDAVVRAARIAGCHEMILSLPSGYDTEIGDSGMFLSGGQRQQVALARALFGSPKLVVLDEPNSNLDVRGDQALRRAMKRLRRMGTTVIIVTHRQSVLSEVDKLLVLQTGAVKAFGPAGEVMTMLRGEQVLQRKRLAPSGEQVLPTVEQAESDTAEEAAQ